MSDGDRPPAPSSSDQPRQGAHDPRLAADVGRTGDDPPEPGEIIPAGLPRPLARQEWEHHRDPQVPPTAGPSTRTAYSHGQGAGPSRRRVSHRSRSRSRSPSRSRTSSPSRSPVKYSETEVNSALDAFSRYVACSCPNEADGRARCVVLTWV